MSGAAKKQVEAALNVVAALADVIRELRSVPSGVLYAQVMGHLSFEQYERILGLLKRAGLVAENGAHILTWTGPDLPVAEPKTDRVPS